MNERVSYSATSKVLHWGMAALILVMALHGWSLEDSTGAALASSLTYHVLGGVAVMFLLIIRAIWRLRRRPSLLPSDTPLVAQRLSMWAHRALYGLMFLVPCTGLLTVMAHDANISLLGIGLRDLMPLSMPFDNRRAMHQWALYGLLSAVIGHIGAALYHHYHLKDGLLTRMALWRET